MSDFQPGKINWPKLGRNQDKANPQEAQEAKQVGRHRFFSPHTQAAQTPEKDKGDESEFSYFSGVSRVQAHYASLCVLANVVVVP